MIKDILLKLITILHIIFILFVIITPFTSSNYFLLIHTIFIPFLIFHWVLNDNTCILTIIEKKLRKDITGKDNVDDDCFTCKLVEPVYDFRKNYAAFTVIIYASVLLLWSISAYKLYSKYQNGEFNDLKRLFTI